MLMYFHQRTQELLLWKEWRPMTQGGSGPWLGGELGGRRRGKGDSAMSDATNTLAQDPGHSARPILGGWVGLGWSRRRMSRGGRTGC